MTHATTHSVFSSLHSLNSRLSMLSEIASPVEVEAAPGPASVSIPVALDEPVASANINFEL